MSYGFYFDQTRCVGCHVCQVACKDRLDLQMAGPRPRRVESWETGKYPNAKLYHTSMGCNHCENPACVAACPTGAMYKDADGIVLHDDDVCISCQACVAACPYGAPQYVELTDMVIKCDSCKPLREAGLPPVCVQGCPYRALEFGDMDELRAAHEAEGELVQELTCTASAQTQPNLLILPVREALDDPDMRYVRM